MRNEMMHRPVIDPDVLAFLRQDQQPLSGDLKKLEEHAHAVGNPVIPHETVNFFRVLLKVARPQSILEVGTAIGFSALLMAQNTPASTKITTIDRFDIMIKHAQANFKKFKMTDRIQLLQGDAADILPTLQPSYDFIFLDSAKAKYIDFLPYCLNLLSDTGILLIDDVLQGGTVLQPIEEIKHRHKNIHRNLNALFETVFHDDSLVSSLIPVGDGLLMITKK
ncbi:O-methyltransferase [Agrilactobacillus yilanensis]|uniref:tRNA 5-hydroxyuridine methyltransferase n=1 Tax=Agrilactobacillus yilanensis TaxID=2485997 RepID=A0ABW4J3T6_9LACO|nr:O-methyltransferase [Agrilactobacillus yilanensis]